MCGITGAVWFDPGLAVRQDTLERMTAVLSHRGPDDEGFHRQDYRAASGYAAAPGVAMGFRRLSIIDLAGGQQPMSNEDGSVWVVLNGEIYNFIELRRRLQAAGHVFRSRSDTETVVHLYEDEGLDFVGHLVGMYAIALWDANARRLVLARDRLGQKPLLYRHEPGRLLFGSELKSILQVPSVPRRLDPAALDAFLLYQYVPHPRSILQGVHKLQPAHLAVYEEDRLVLRRYWAPRPQEEGPSALGQARDALRAALDESLRLQMRSDVPVGVFLSGGIDSAIVAGLALQHAEGPLSSFTIGFPVAEYDESATARDSARRLGTEHHELCVTIEPREVLPQLAWHFDEPFADSSAIPTWHVARLARRHVKVVLSGDGGDELFAGYDRYAAVRLGACMDRLPAPARSLFTTTLWRHLPASTRQKSPLRRWKRFVEALRLPPGRRYLEWIGIFNEPQRASLLRREFIVQLEGTDPALFVLEPFREFAQRDSVTKASLTDLVTYLPCDLMVKVDMATMAHGLECRQPFLDHRVVELAAGLPIEMKVRHGETKWILKEACRAWVPGEARRRRKMGFGVPLELWFRRELREFSRDVLFDTRTRQREYFQPQAVARLWEDHQSGRFNHGYRLWALLVFELWCRQWLDGS